MPRNHTSAVNGMSVAEMRKCLSEVREFLGNQSSKKPFEINAKLSNGMEIWKFVHLVANGLHKKRANSRNKRVDEDEAELNA